MAKSDDTRTQSCDHGLGCTAGEPIPLGAAQIRRMNGQLAFAVGSDLPLAKALSAALIRLAERGDLSVAVQVLESLAEFGPRGAVRPVVDLLAAQPHVFEENREPWGS